MGGEIPCTECSRGPGSLPVLHMHPRVPAPKGWLFFTPTCSPLLLDKDRSDGMCTEVWDLMGWSIMGRVLLVPSTNLAVRARPEALGDGLARPCPGSPWHTRGL